MATLRSDEFEGVARAAWNISTTATNGKCFMLDLQATPAWAAFARKYDLCKESKEIVSEIIKKMLADLNTLSSHTYVTLMERCRDDVGPACCNIFNS